MAERNNLRDLYQARIKCAFRPGLCHVPMLERQPITRKAWIHGWPHLCTASGSGMSTAEDFALIRFDVFLRNDHVPAHVPYK
ncbi:hypothetical protein RRG08_015755 [Elysia crispata]|uniref:Uncharacterized protein n=1 Tax=Elysia crispata TaxID=231223 RepID=A0AAE0ZGZ3_9GAST|nr:hypothetical protein RRG08_015755 [Elysia crispata]